MIIHYNPPFETRGGFIFITWLHTLQAKIDWCSSREIDFIVSNDVELVFDDTLIFRAIAGGICVALILYMLYYFIIGRRKYLILERM